MLLILASLFFLNEKTDNETLYTQKKNDVFEKKWNFDILKIQSTRNWLT